MRPLVPLTVATAVMYGCAASDTEKSYYGDPSTDDLLHLTPDTGSDGGSGELGDSAIESAAAIAGS